MDENLLAAGCGVPAGSSRLLAYSSQTLEAALREPYCAGMTNRTPFQESSVAATTASSAPVTAAGDVPFAERRAALCAELTWLLERRTGVDGGHETAIPE